MTSRFSSKRSCSSSNEGTPKKRAVPEIITLAINDDNKGAMGFRFERHLTKIVELIKGFKIKGCKVTSWHKQFKWWGIVHYDESVRPAPHSVPLLFISALAGRFSSPHVA